MYTQALLFALVGVAQSHMSLFYPPPLGGAPSINKQSTKLDKEFNFPLGCCGAGGPTKPSPGLCRGHLDKFDTETAQVTWQPGQDAHFQLTDYNYDANAPGSTHSGGSCQVGFSVDKGATWKVAASYHGACPYHTTDGSPEAQTFDFKVPTGMPSGDALFAWIWLNREHESFMGCSKVNIGGSGSDNTSPAPPAKSSPATQPKPTPSVIQSKQSQQPPAQTPRPTTSAGSSRRTRPTSTSSSSYSRATSATLKSSVDADVVDEVVQDDQTTWTPHPEVKDGVRRFEVDGYRCDCRRDEFTLSPRCACDSKDSINDTKRATIERKAVRMHRRSMVKRVDACNWASAPAMEVSYYTADAKCAPNAKKNTPQSDTFELGWNVNCGVVQAADGQYPIKMMDCQNLYG